MHACEELERRDFHSQRNDRICGWSKALQALVERIMACFAVGRSVLHGSTVYACLHEVVGKIAHCWAKPRPAMTDTHAHARQHVGPEPERCRSLLVV
jgi:hypothetical protein